MTWNDFRQWVEGEKEAFDFDPAPAAPRAPRKKKTAREKETGIRLVSIATAVVLLAVLLSVIYAMPPFGSGEVTYNELAERYVEQGVYEVGAQNLVLNMTLIYRGFDTLGEAVLLFSAVVCVIMLLSGTADKPECAVPEREDTALKTVVRGLFPFVFVFGVYILMTGHLSPSGGFYGGSVLGVGLILLDVSLGRETVRRFFDRRVFNGICAAALCFYCLAVTWMSVCGANGLDDHIGAGRPGSLFSGGLIMPIVLAVGFVVACAVYAFFTYFYRGELE